MSCVLIGGGVRCGKSAFALARARRAGARLAFIATAQARDDEMAERIERHRRERQGMFATYEEPLALPERLRALARGGQFDAVVIDCLTLWLANRLMRGDDADSLERGVEQLAHVLGEDDGCTRVVVSNEVGMGLVPDHALGRAFRDAAGRAHQRLSRVADEIYFGMLGSMVRLRPGPLELLAPAEHGAPPTRPT